MVLFDLSNPVLAAVQVSFPRAVPAAFRNPFNGFNCPLCRLAGILNLSGRLAGRFARPRTHFPIKPHRLLPAGETLIAALFVELAHYGQFSPMLNQSPPPVNSNRKKPIPAGSAWDKFLHKPMPGVESVMCRSGRATLQRSRSPPSLSPLAGREPERERPEQKSRIAPMNGPELPLPLPHKLVGERGSQ